MDLQSRFLVTHHFYNASIDPPIVLGTAANFAALVYMRSLKGCEDAIIDLNGAEISRETILRVAFATKADLQKALSIQEQMVKN